MAETFRVACVQNCAERDMAPSIAALEPLIRGAAKDGAQLIVLPEMATMIEPQNPKVLEKAVPEAADPGLKRFRALAKETGSWILVGSLLFKAEGENRVVNRSLLVDPTGAVTARYDKLHMFDVDLASGETYRESATVKPGNRAVVAATPWGPMAFRSAMTCASPISIGRWLMRAPATSRFQPPSPTPPARPIGMCWSAPGRSRRAATSSPPTRAAFTPKAAGPGAIA